MALFGKDGWRAQGEVFSVWFGLLNRLARYAAAGPASSGWVRRQHFPDGLLGRPWDASLVTLAAIATGAILYDGLSQTELYFDLFGLPDLATSTLVLAGFLALVSALALLVARRVGMTAMGAGLLPISVGYLIAHYLTYLLGDGQRILVAIADPLQLGWDLTGTAFYEPDHVVPAVARLDDHVQRRRRRPRPGRLGGTPPHGRPDSRLPRSTRPAATGGGHGGPHDADPLEPRPGRLHAPSHRPHPHPHPHRPGPRGAAASGHPLKETSPMRRTLVLVPTLLFLAGCGAASTPPSASPPSAAPEAAAAPVASDAGPAMLPDPGLLGARDGPQPLPVLPDRSARTRSWRHPT